MAGALFTIHPPVSPVFGAAILEMDTYRNVTAMADTTGHIYANNFISSFEQW